MLSEIVLGICLVALVVDRIVQARIWAKERKLFVAALIADNAAEFRFIAETEPKTKKESKPEPVLTQVGI